jgi:hypothetical protein
VTATLRNQALQPIAPVTSAPLTIHLHGIELADEVAKDGGTVAGHLDHRRREAGAGFYHFSTQLLDTSRYETISNGCGNKKKLNKTIHHDTEQNRPARLQAHFKTGALNHSATLPHPIFKHLTNRPCYQNNELPPERSPFVRKSVQFPASFFQHTTECRLDNIGCTIAAVLEQVTVNAESDRY